MEKHVYERCLRLFETMIEHILREFGELLAISGFYRLRTGNRSRIVLKLSYRILRRSLIQVFVLYCNPPIDIPQISMLCLKLNSKHPILELQSLQCATNFGS